MYILKMKFALKSCSTVYLFKDILIKALLSFAYLVPASSLQTSKKDFVMFNVSHKSLQNTQKVNYR